MLAIRIKINNNLSTTAPILKGQPIELSLACYSELREGWVRLRCETHDSHDGSFKEAIWIDRPLEIGEKLQVEIIEAEECDEPDSITTTAPQDVSADLACIICGNHFLREELYVADRAAVCHQCVGFMSLAISTP